MPEKIEEASFVKKTEKKEKEETQIEYIKRMLESKEEDNSSIFDQAIDSRMINRFYFIKKLGSAKTQKKGKLFITIPPKMFINNLRPILTKDEAIIDFYVYEWDEKDHKQKKKVSRTLDRREADGSVTKIENDAEYVLRYHVVERIKKGNSIQRDVYDVVERTKKLTEDLQRRVEAEQ